MKTAKILVIEDAPELAGALSDMISHMGHQGLVEHSGKEGLAVALAEKPDLIFLDLRLPDIDGFEVLRELRKDPWGKTANVTILTAADTSEHLPDDLDIPPHKILHKWQWGIDNLTARIEAELFNDAQKPH